MARNPVIINVRGTSGAGKTTLVREVLKHYPFMLPVTFEGRKQPLYYIYHGREGAPPLALLGHYESACGGCDTISKYIPELWVGNSDETHRIRATEGQEGNSYDTIFGLVKAHYKLGHDVLFEGLLLSGDMARTTALHKDGFPVNVVAINIPIEQCIESVIARRLAASNLKPFNEKNTREKHKLLQKCLAKFKSLGISTFDCDNRRAALNEVLLLLGLPTPEEGPIMSGVDVLRTFPEVTPEFARAAAIEAGEITEDEA